MREPTNDPPAARVYRVEPESEPLNAADYLRAQADLTLAWIDTDAARDLPAEGVAVSKYLSAATLEVLAELDRCRSELKWAFANAGQLAESRVGLKERVRRLNRFRDHIDAVIYPRDKAEA